MILLTISTWGIKTFLKIAIMGSGPIPNLLAQELNSSAEIELFTSQNVEIDGINVSDYQSLLTSPLDFNVVIFAWRGMPKTETEKAVVLRHIVKRASPETLFVNLSSVSVYGQNSDVNFETTIPRPINSYGYSKYYLERYLNIFALSKVCNLRISNVFGHPDFEDVLNIMLKNLKSKRSTQIMDPDNIFRDFISVETVVRVIQFVLCDKQFHSHRIVYNISSGASIPLSSLIYLVQSIFNSELSLQKEGLLENTITRSFVSNDKIKGIYPVLKSSEAKKLHNYITNWTR